TIAASQRISAASRCRTAPTVSLVERVVQRAKASYARIVRLRRYRAPRAAASCFARYNGKPIMRAIVRPHLGMLGIEPLRAMLEYARMRFMNDDGVAACDGHPGVF